MTPFVGQFCNVELNSCALSQKPNGITASSPSEVTKFDVAKRRINHTCP